MSRTLLSIFATVLPVAKPIGSPSSIIGSNNAGSSHVGSGKAGQSGAFPAVTGKVTLNTAAKVQKIKRGPPMWIWYGVGAGVLLVITLVIFVVMKFK